LAALSPQRADRAIELILSWLRHCLPVGCGIGGGPIGDHADAGFAAEEQLIDHAVQRRRREFRAGRSAAREALAQLGCVPVPILARPQRDPIWPTGFVGSITHCEGCTLAIAAPTRLMQAMGLDLEEDVALERALVGAVCRPEEREQQQAFAALGIDQAKLCFIAKEAVYKAIFPRERVMLDFQQMRVGFDASQRSFEAFRGSPAGDAASRIAGIGRFRHESPLLAALFVIPAPDRHGDGSREPATAAAV